MKNRMLACILAALMIFALAACDKTETTNLGETTDATKNIGETAPMTELGIAYYVVEDETITVKGAVYAACEPRGEATAAVVGLVSASENDGLIGQTVYATDASGIVAIARADAPGGYANYRYVGTTAGGSMADYMQIFAISADTVNRIDLCANALNREETNGEIVSFTPHRLTITDATAVGELLDAMTLMERDAAAYEALLAATDQPYEGYVRVELLHQNADGSLRDYGSFVYYPKLGFTNDGCRMSEVLVALIEAHLGGQQ